MADENIIFDFLDKTGLRFQVIDQCGSEKNENDLIEGMTRFREYVESVIETHKIDAIKMILNRS